MRILNYGILAAAAGTLLLLAACGENSPQQNAESSAPQTEAVTTVTAAETTTAISTNRNDPMFLRIISCPSCQNDIFCVPLKPAAAQRCRERITSSMPLP